MCRYWWKVCKHAFHDTNAIVGYNWRKSLTGWLGIVVASVLYAYWWGVGLALSKLEWVGIGAIGAIIIWLFVFLICLFRTPARMEEEQRVAKEKELAEYHKKVEEAKIKIELLDAERLHKHPERQLLRDNLAQRLAECEKLLNSIRSGDANAVRDFYRLQADVGNYMGKNWSQRDEFREKRRGLSQFVMPRVNADFHIHAAECENMIKKLKKVLAVLS